jgi:transcriptional regulator with XRE-family HTH domain
LFGNQTKKGATKMNYQELREKRTSLGYTRKEFSEKLGISLSKISKMENGWPLITPELENKILKLKANKTVKATIKKPVKPITKPAKTKTK